jgi:glutathione-regulated potassium-efflux system ancillary protein KefC/glutathione-regulated potassium-efflux system protein KefB
MLSLKMLVLYGLGKGFALPGPAPRNLAYVLPAGGEFAFVIFNSAAGYRVFDSHVGDLLNVAVTLSMALTPFLVLFNERVIAHYEREHAAPQFDRIDEPATPVIIAGFGRFGQIVARLLRMKNIPFTALESNIDQVETVRRFGNKIYYGDASRLELLRAAKAGEARFLVIAVDDMEASVRTAELVRKHFPNLVVLARARNRRHAHLLMELGVKTIVRETFHSSVRLTEDLMQALGLAPREIEQTVALFEKHDEALLQRQYAVFRDETKLIQTSKEAAQELEQLLQEDSRSSPA